MNDYLLIQTGRESMDSDASSMTRSEGPPNLVDFHLIVEDVFGRVVDPVTGLEQAIRRFTFSNNNNMVVQVINYGAAITSIRVPDAYKCFADVVLGYDHIGEYILPRNNLPRSLSYMGAAIGRVANRIGKAGFALGERRVRLNRNDKDKHTLHGGKIGFDKVIWIVDALSQQDCTLRLKHISPHGHEGFPGKLVTTIDFKLTEDNEFHMTFKSNTDKPTPVSLTNHTYFNLGGHDTGKSRIYEHQIQINAEKYIEVGEDEMIPTGKLKDVKGTAFDFRKLTKLGSRMMHRHGEGFDQTYCVLDNTLRVVAIAFDAESGRRLEVISDQPAVHFYTANYLPDPRTMERPIEGKRSAEYVRQCGFCFLPHGYPDAVNHDNFPSMILEPKDTYENNIIYKFTAS